MLDWGFFVANLQQCGKPVLHIAVAKYPMGGSTAEKEESPAFIIC
jgi:hypothetical protein